MKKIKDFVYNTSDILVAFVILIVACGVIFWRMETILDYPSKVLGFDKHDTTITEPIDVDPSATEDPGTTEDPTENIPKEQEYATDILENGKLTRDITIKIPKGTATQAIQPFIDAGIFADFDEFKECCKAVGRSCNNVSGSTVKLEEGMSQLDVTEMITFK